MMNEGIMQAVLMRYVMDEKHHEVVLPSSTLYNWEADLLTITRAWLVHEWEVKVTRGDFRADAGKRKHYFVKLASDRGFNYGPNYFWYATHGFEVDPAEIPAYAGWVQVTWRDPYHWEKDGRYEVRVMKKAPRLHVHKLNDRARSALLRWLSFKVKNAYRYAFLKMDEELKELP